MEQYTWMILYSLCSYFKFSNGCYQVCWRSRIKPWSNIHGWCCIVYVVSIYSIMDVIKDVEELGLTHGAIIHEWYYIVYVVNLFSIMDVIKYVEEVELNHGEIYMDDTI